VDVYVEGQSVIFDFASVEAPGAFAPGEFDGYIVKFTPSEHAPGLVFAAPDDAQTTLAFDPSRIGFDATQIELDFAGLRYDPDSFVKVDLVLVPSDSPSLAR
ncbi:MAG: hypothetical protein WBG86_11725, partial [Polyangiales bacterium]